MSLLDQLWDDTVAGPRPDSGLGKLRKQSSLGFRSLNSSDANKESDGGSMRSAVDNPGRVTRSITILKPPPVLGDQSETPPASPAGSTTPNSPLSRGGSFQFRRRSVLETYEKASGIGFKSPRPPYDI
ncbi:dormancy-associated protein-like [Heracleum sosnowskyi]|uniref:Dormancy-associated protein-like n=1 Tax=Heracleum sosnowskyi TaxID=360622 RepID=A0AAD8HNX2_9APIA|nr:dormancy-associated protein-like [Heracleum sosnowskyi]